MMKRSTIVLAVLALLAPIWGGLGVARAQIAGTQRVSGTRLAALADRAVHGIRVGSDATIVPAFTVADQLLQSGKLSLVVGSALVNPSYINVPIELDVNGHFVRTIFVGYRVQRWVDTAVAARDLVPGTLLTARDLRVARVPFDGQQVNGTRVLVGRRILSAFRAGQPVAIEATQINQIVKPGASVVLIVHDGGVSVVADVVARNGGGLGDQISVFNPQTNKTLSGTIVGPDRVELNLGDTQ